MRTKLTAAAVCVVAVGVAHVALAQPRILSLDGTLAQGQELRIIGADFGFKAQPAPERWDDFENGVSSECTQPPCNPGLSGSSFIDQSMLNLYNGPFDTQAYDCRQPYYSDRRQRYQGDMSIAQDFWSMPNGCGSNRVIGVLDQPSQVWYVSYWCYQDDYAGTALNSANVKITPFYFLQNWSNEYQFHWQEFWNDRSGYIAASTCNLDPVFQQGGTYRDSRGRWTRVESYLDIGDPGVANGWMAASKDLQILAQHSGLFRPADCADQEPGTVQIGNNYFDTNGAAVVQYISELYVDHTFARVEVGDAPTWGACTRREIQVPTAWDQNGISIQGNLGQFQTGETVYLYVVDENNQPSAGEAVVIGVGNDPTDLGPPGPPGRPIPSGTGG